MERLKLRVSGLPGGRAALFAAAIAPMSVWPLSGATLVHPWQAFAWALCCATLLASFPGRGARISVWLLVAALPWSLGWIGSVAVTGYGPSNAALSAAGSGAFRELLAAVQLALARPAFLAASLLSLLALVWAWRAVLPTEGRAPNSAGAVFLCALLPVAAANMNGSAYPDLAALSAPEARSSVVWFSHIGIAKEAVSQAVDVMARGHVPAAKIRSANDAERLFQAADGLAVFVAGESLRADALLVEGRGPWSSALAERIKKGLGVRLGDACAGGNATFTSLPRLFTAVDPADTIGAAEKPTILAHAKAGGAKTAYIMNHETWVVPESGHDLIHKTSSMERTTLDDEAVTALADFTKRSGKGAKAAIMHLYGQHFAYHDRYPRALFPEEPKALNGEQREALRYDRAAEYGVKVLLDLADVLDRQAEPAFLVFTSDHGENLPSDGTGKRLHAGPVSGIDDTMVPALVLWNQAFAESGRQRLLDKLVAAPSIAHRDVAKAWLVLAGLPETLEPTGRPTTWGALEAGVPSGSLDCRKLKR